MCDYSKNIKTISWFFLIWNKTFLILSKNSLTKTRFFKKQTKLRNLPTTRYYDATSILQRNPLRHRQKKREIFLKLSRGREKDKLFDCDVSQLKIKTTF